MSAILVVVLNVGLAAVIYLLLVRRIDRRLEPGRVVDAIRSEIDGIIVELNQTTDRNIGLIEDRVTRLNALLEQADRRLAVLKREIESRSSSTERYNDIVKRAPRPETPATVSSGSETPGSETPGSETPGRETPGRGTPAGPTSGGGAAGTGSVQGGERPVGSRAERRKEIIELHRKGIAANIIANRMGSTVGEVELIISLADRKE
jgi:hypothetical protein